MRPILPIIFFMTFGCSPKTKVIERFTNGNPKKIILWTSKVKYFERELYENGKIKTEKFFLNGLQDGFEYHFRENGVKIAEAEFKKGVRNGITHEFWANGQIAFEGTCHNGVFEGPYTNYFDNGKILSIGSKHLGQDTGWFYYLNLIGDTLRMTYQKSIKDSMFFFNGKRQQITSDQWENISSPDWEIGL